MVVAILVSLTSAAQFRLVIMGGGHQASVIEENNLPGWDSLKDNYSAHNGVHFGVLADLPLGKKSHLSFQPGAVYHQKGRKYIQYFDPATNINHIISKTTMQYINYIDVPLNLVLKFGKKVKFVIGAGPYASFFYTGKVTTETLTQTSTTVSTDYNNVLTGNKPGQYQVFNYGVNGLAGFEFGPVLLTANYSRGLNDFYQETYTGTFRHQVIGGTLGIFLGKPKVKKPIEKDKDKDKDGIPDSKDNCPDEAGTAITNGCPDKDGDGIADKDDKCPDVPGAVTNNGCPAISDRDKDGVNDTEDKCPDMPGVKKYYGCPVPDTDHDGLTDDIDKCPTVAGVVRYYGCPVPDTDGDGVNDEEDKCPAVKGTMDNKGCPAAPPIKKAIVEKVNYAARRIQFKYASPDLLTASYKVLDEVVKILKENPDIKLSIEGHTSNDGIPEANMKLSQARANNVKAYLQSKGIEASRLKAKGFGPAQPINNGKTEAEKSQNRRVELKLSN